MAAVRDPAFWKRFSVAVHLDEEAAQSEQSLKHTDSWLLRQQKKGSRQSCLCWIFWLGIIALAVTIALVIIWLKTSGKLDHDDGESADGV